MTKYLAPREVKVTLRLYTDAPMLDLKDRGWWADRFHHLASRLGTSTWAVQGVDVLTEAKEPPKTEDGE